jgi:hypothetical protein
MAADMENLLRLLVLAIPVAWAAWTLTHEEVFREVREFCDARSHSSNNLVCRKFFFLFTCEYCLSHWCALGFELIFRLQLVFDDWRGYLVGYVCLIWIANIYMNLFWRLRVDIRHERAAADRTRQKADNAA